MIAPLFVGRPKSINALEAVMENNKEIVLLTQKKPSTEDPKSKDLYETGTIGNILQLLKLPDGTVKVLIEGKRRCLIKKFTELELFLEAEVNVIEENVNEEKNNLEQIDELINVFEQYVKINGKINSDVISTISEIVNAGELSDNVINHLLLGIEEKQRFLEMLDPHERIEKLIVKINSELGILESEKKVRGRVKRQMEKTQREYYLNEQLKAIQKELGSSEEGKNEFDEIEEKNKKGQFNKRSKRKG
jgi:ATP-dependent Lon protease